MFKNLTILALFSTLTFIGGTHVGEHQMEETIETEYAKIQEITENTDIIPFDWN